jgi:hypothetical protein
MKKNEGKTIDIIIDNNDLKRFWSKIKKTDTCWIWMASKNTYGYGRFGLGEKCLLAHRVSFFIHYGYLTPGLQVQHKPIVCHNTSCVNPDHLKEGLHKNNIEDQLLDGTLVVPSQIGENHSNVKLTEDDVYSIRSLYATGKYTQKELGENYGVSRPYISRIICNVNWKHLEKK